jgi:poly-D-alanine transfer protein DltD
LQELDQHITRINQKLQLLLKNYHQLQKDNERQSKLIQTLQQEKENNTTSIHILQQQVHILKASVGNMSEIEKKEFEKNINQYIKEIDKCITFLSE